MDVTVVVPTIPERASLLSRCLWYLEREPVDVIVCRSGSGKGDKLNRAFSLVETSHVLVCDDDDWMTGLTPLLEECFTEDWVGFDLCELVEGRFNRIVREEPGSHLCPVRTELARQVPFGNDYLAAYEWTATVRTLIRSEAYLDSALYFYDKWNGPDSWSPPRDVGWWPVDETKFRWV